MKTIYSIIIKIYLVWSRIYRYFERSMPYYNNFKNEFNKKIPLVSSESMWRILVELIHYEKDKIYHLWDVTSDPFFILKRGWGDCDDYSAIAYYMLGTTIEYRNKIYKYIGTFYLIYKTGGHVIFLWKRELDGTCLMISTKKLSIQKNIKAAFSNFENKKAIAHVMADNEKGFFDVKYKTIYMPEDFERMGDL